MIIENKSIRTSSWLASAEVYLLIMCFLFSGTSAFAQKAVLYKGTVVDNSNQPMVGVSVVIKGTQQGSITDLSGKFAISAKRGEKLIFRYLGFETKEVVLDENTVIFINMNETVHNIDELVVIGYGTMRKSDLTGSVTSIKTDNIIEQSKASLENFLQGRVSGVQVTSQDGTPGGGLSVTIRGAASITASTEPLYVIDGFPVINEDIDNSSVMSSNSGRISPLATINPSDIASMEILKDASATAIYGSRASNGVVLITTKSGQMGKPRITYEGNYAVEQITKKIDMISQTKYLEIVKAMSPFEGFGAYSNENGDIKESLYNPNAYMDWQDEIFRLGQIQNHQVSVSGGTQNAKYNISLGLFDQNGIVINSDFSRLTNRVNLDVTLNKFIDVGTRSTFTYLQTNGPWSGGTNNQFSGIVYKALKYRPINPAYIDENGDAFPIEAGDMIDEEMANTTNPVRFAYDVEKLKYQTRILNNSFIVFHILKGLDLKISGGVDFGNTRNKRFFPKNTDIGRLANGRAEVDNNTNLTWLNENILTYKRKLKNNQSINLLAGYSYQKYLFDGIFNDVRDYGLETNKFYDISAAKLAFIYNSIYREFVTASLFGRVNYNYKQRYLLTASFRRDGSSKFGANNKWANFPSAAIAWRIDQESFYKELRIKDIVSNFKLRASAGITGNQNILPYASLAKLEGVQYVFNNTAVNGYSPTSLSSPDLKWERTDQLDFGVEIGFFNNRLMFTYDYYNKETNDMLLNARIPTSSGFASKMMNVGSINQWGHELSMDANVVTGKFKWNIGGNISFEGNKVLSIGENEEMLVSGGGPYTIHKIVPGGSLGQFYGVLSDNLYQAEDFDDVETGKLKDGVPKQSGISKHAPGDMKYKDLSGPDGTPDGIVDNYDQVVIGSALPDFYGGLTSTMSYAGFELKMFFNFKYGNKIYNINNYYLGVPTVNQTQNYFKRVENYWTPENTDTNIPRLINTTGQSSTTTTYPTDFFLEDGSYLRLSNVVLGYSLPKKAIKFLNVESLRCYISADNLLTLTNYSGYDPDVSMSRNSLAPGIDANPYPRSRVYKLGVSFGF